MTITDVKIRKVGKTRLKAIASITFDGLLSVNDFKVIQARRRLCIAYPENQNSCLEHPQYVVVPRTPEISRTIEQRILEAYSKAIA